MSRLAPLFLLALSLLTPSCVVPSETEPTPVDSADDTDTADDLGGYTVYFDGTADDTVTVTCGDSSDEASLDADGYASLDVDCANLPYFNVGDNDDPNVLAEIIDNGNGGLIPVPHLQVRLGEMVLYPVTVNHDDGGRFPLCDVPQWDVDSGGMPYGSLEAWGEDLCSS